MMLHLSASNCHGSVSVMACPRLTGETAPWLRARKVLRTATLSAEAAGTHLAENPCRRAAPEAPKTVECTPEPGSREFVGRARDLRRRLDTFQNSCRPQ